MSIPLRNYSSSNHYFAHILAYAISLAWSERKYLDSQSLEVNMGWCRGLVGLCAHRYSLREPEMLSTQGYLFKGVQPVCLPEGCKQTWLIPCWPLHLRPGHTRAPAPRPLPWTCLSWSIYSPILPSDPYLVAIFSVNLYNLSFHKDITIFMVIKILPSLWKCHLHLAKNFNVVTSKSLCAHGTELIVTGSQIMLCLNMSEIKYLMSDFWSLNQHQLLSHVELNCLLVSHGWTLLAMVFARTLKKYR